MKTNFSGKEFTFLKIALTFLVAVFVVAFLPLNFGKVNADANMRRVLIKPNSISANAKIKAMNLDLRHSFPDGSFSAHVPEQAISKLSQLATVEDVKLFAYNAKPSCGNGVVDGGEKCGEPGLSCPDGTVCSACKCVTDGGGTGGGSRACTPSAQRDYNVTQVNGGQVGLGAGVNVAVLDSGIYSDHLDLKDNIILCKDTTKRGIRNGCNDTDSVAHGTHSAGIIAASGGSDGQGLFGVAPSANLMIVKVCGGGGCWGDDIAAAIDYVASQGAHIINMSLGADGESTLIRDAINRNTSVLVIASAGNDGPSVGSIDYPGANPTLDTM